MFQYGGVAGYCSDHSRKQYGRDDRVYICRETFVRPWRITCFVSRPHHDLIARRPAILWSAFSALRACFRNDQLPIDLPADISLCATASKDHGFMARQPLPLSFALALNAGSGLLPRCDGGQVKIHMRAQTGTRIRRNHETRRRSRRGDPPDSSPPMNRGRRRQYWLSGKRQKQAYNNARKTIGVETRTFLVSSSRITRSR